jgi:hypothetical protein
LKGRLYGIEPAELTKESVKRPDALLRVLNQSSFLYHFVTTDRDNGVDWCHREAHEKHSAFRDSDFSSKVAGFIRPSVTRYLFEWT